MAGRHADTRGAKHGVIVGLVLATAAGMLYFISLQFVGQPAMSVTILLLRRALLGVGESYVITGAQTWGLLLGGPSRAVDPTGSGDARGRRHECLGGARAPA